MRCPIMRPSFLTSFSLSAAVIILLAGCSTISGSTVKIHQSAKGSVQLEEVADWSYEASHPVMVDSTIIAKVLQGVQADASASVSSKLPAGGSKPMRIFSDEDVNFLAPLLAQALSHAKPEHIVGFRISSSAGSGSEPTAGTIYVEKAALYFTLTQYPGKPAKMTFAPASLGRIEPATANASLGQSRSMTVVMDYQAIAKAPAIAPFAPLAMAKPAAALPEIATTAIAAPVSMTERSQTTSAIATSQEQHEIEFMNKKLDELRQAKDAISKKDTEIQMLKKEADWMKRELRERDAEMKAMKATKAKTVTTKKAPTKPKAAQLSPLRP